jgi:hypothetical protein
MLNKIMLPADADAQRARLTSAGTALTGHLAETGSAGAGLVVRIRPWTVSMSTKTSVSTKTSGVTPGRYAASMSFTQTRNALITAQPSTAAASGLCASKKYQEKARSAAAIGGALGPLPPRDPV